MSSDTEAAPGAEEIEAAAAAVNKGVYVEDRIVTSSRMSAALTAAYAIRLPPLLAELERYRELVRDIADSNSSAAGMLKARAILRAEALGADEVRQYGSHAEAVRAYLAARQALQEQSGE